MHLVLPARPAFALGVLAALLLAACADQPTEPPRGGPPPGDLATRAIAVHVDVAAGTATPLGRTAAEAPASGAQFALLGINEIGATTSNVTRSAVGQFTPKKVTIRFDVALTNRSTVPLLAPTFPTPPAGNKALLLFPFSTTVTGGSGAVDAGVDWDGGLTNFFNDGTCATKTISDCYRFEPFPAPLDAGARTPARTVGFDVAPSVTDFVVYLVLAADLQIPASIGGAVTSPQRGALGGITVTLDPGGHIATTDGTTGGYSFTGLVPGSYTLALTGLPPFCSQPAAQAVSVGSAGNATVNVSVPCPFIAFTSDRDGHDEIYRMNADGSGQVRLTNSSVCFNSNPAWSPDGALIAFQCRVIASNVFDPTIDIFVMKADGSGQVNLTRGTTQNQEPAWSPDGRIAFSSHRDGNDEIYVMNADGSGAQRLTQTPDSAEFFPSWAPDGSRITFAKQIYKLENGRLVPDGDDDIWTMKADGSDAVFLQGTPGGTDRDPSWSPTGKVIAFFSATFGGSQIFTVDAADGTGRTQLTQLSLAADPEWFPDASKLVFAGLSTNSQSFDIFLMNADGSGVINLTNAAGADHFPAVQP